METSLYKIKLNDGRKFRVFCENSSQKNRFWKVFMQIQDKFDASVEVISTGIHTIKQLESIANNL